MSVTAIPSGLSRPRERWSRRKAIYYRETATPVHDSGAARGDVAMASMMNLRILYRMYDAPKSIITLTVKVSLTSRITIKTGQNVCPGDLRATITLDRERVNADETGLFWKCLPDKTMSFKGDTCSGGKRSKERITVMVCASMSGEKVSLWLLVNLKIPDASRMYVLFLSPTKQIHGHG